VESWNFDRKRMRRIFGVLVLFMFFHSPRLLPNSETTMVDIARPVSSA
jgi:hypothetical protein